jgi:hypothetical protein
VILDDRKSIYRDDEMIGESTVRVVRESDSYWCLGLETATTSTNHRR